ncbi:MAG: hypothetical protein JWP27_565 [Flaviaesturariibacter sp.]|nr:hypothetical protein [Flaviaesturariibacter sp.]
MCDGRDRCTLYLGRMQPASCANCAIALEPSYTFCPACGQKTAVHRLGIGHLAHEGLHFFTHADKGIVLLIRDLAIRPGRVARAYITGRRTAHYSPLSFFFLVLGIFVLTLSFLHTFERSDTFATMRANASHIPDPATRQRVLGKLARATQANRFMDKYGNFVAIVATPVVALVFLLCYARRGYNYAEHLVANLYFTGFCGLVFILFFAPLLALLPQRLYMVGIGGYLLFTLVYRTAAYAGMMEARTARAYLHAFAASMATVVTWFVLSGFAVTYYINKGFSF